MQIRPVSLPFKGYVEVNCQQGNYRNTNPVTFNTKSIAYSPSILNPGKTEIYAGNKTFLADCSYDTFQKACMKADKSGKVECISANSTFDEDN